MGEPGATARTEPLPSGYARYVGRVGGLAFALGVGAAVLTGTAVAWADTSDPTGGSGASQSSSSSRHQRTDAGPTKSGSGADADTTATDSDDEAAAADQESESRTTPDVVDKSAGRKPAWETRRAEVRAGRAEARYLAYTTSANNDRLPRFTVVGSTAAVGSEKLLLESSEPAAYIHHGGAIGFGPDGTLSWGKGDNGSGSNAQDLTNIHGKILRLNPDGSTPDNPSLGPGALPQIYAYGLRNPFRLTFTPDGKLLVADVGQEAFEELDLVTAGGNYGWPDAEGSCTSDCVGKIDPIYTYPHGGGAVFTSGVYNGATFGPGLNKVFIADTMQGWIKVLTCTPEFTSCGNAQDFDPQGGPTVVLAQRADGDIYQLTYSPGALVRIAPAGGSSSAAAVV